MITYRIFLISLGIISISMMYQVICYLVDKIKNKERVFITDYMNSIARTGFVFVAVMVNIFALIFGSIVPYTQQEKDKTLIVEYTDNIEMYQDYSNEYLEAATKQISEYQEMQSEMARTATLIQMQFWSEQQDVIGDNISKEIKRFQELIMEQKLDINKANARIEQRLKNKWIFGL